MDRHVDIFLGGVGFPLPVFFPSVSSIKTNFPAVDYVQLLVAAGISQFLVSAYDVAKCSEKEQLAFAIDSAIEERTVILLDSGNYESYWLRDLEWTQTQFHEVLKSQMWPVAFSFDVICGPSKSNELCAKEIADSCLEDQSFHPSCSLLPIVHGASENLPTLCRAVASFLNPLAVAVPERELGDGILARVATVRQIRRGLNRL